MSEIKKWIITLSDNRSVSEVKKALSALGFTVEQVMEEIGCIMGKASTEIAHKAKSIPGVTDVSEEHPPFNVGSPDQQVTW
jgi:hypothetical protein